MQYLLLWSVVPILIFTPIPSRLLWYIADSFASMALLCGIMATTLLSALRGVRDKSLTAFASLLICGIFSYSLVEFIPKTFASATRHPRRARLDRLIEVFRDHPEGKVLVHGPSFGWNSKQHSNVEKIYLRMLGDRLEIFEELEEWHTASAKTRYSFAIVPKEQLTDLEAGFSQTAIAKLGPFRDRAMPLFAMSQLDTGSDLFKHRIVANDTGDGTNIARAVSTQLPIREQSRRGNE